MYLFYTPDIETTLTLSEEESAHCVQVLRTERDEEILVTDGVGHLYHCRVTNPHRKHCEVEILSVEQPEPLHDGYVHIAIAPTKNIDRLEWMIEKCTEMGIDEITPLLCEHSERKNINDERLHKIMVSAAKQSLKTTFPRLNSLIRYADLIAQTQQEDRFIAHCMSDEEKKALCSSPENESLGSSLSANYEATDSKGSLNDLATRGHSTIVLIGPEGDFSPNEVKLALTNHYRAVSLGKARLRTETAGVAACLTVILKNS